MSNLSNRTLLVTVHLSSFDPARRDKSGKSAVAGFHQGQEESFNVKKYLVDPAALKPITAAGQRLREVVKKYSSPWLENVRIMPVTAFRELSIEFEKIKQQWEAAVNDFVSNYPAMVFQAETSLGNAFDCSQYPSDIRRKFNVTLDIQPYAGAIDFRSDLLGNDEAAIKAEIEQQEKSRLSSTVSDVFDRASEYLKKVAEILNRTDKGSRIRTELFSSCKSFVALLGSLNFYNDPKLAGLLSEMSAVIPAIDTDQAAGNSAYKAEAAKKVNDILAKFSL